jgi:pyruvate formate lyase activating enzyme
MPLTGLIFNIQAFSLHDGQGIRNLIFFKGCPLRCQWCSNPESQEQYPEIAYNPWKCLGISICGDCLSVCPAGSLIARKNVFYFYRERCSGHLKCVKNCPTGARFTYGVEMNAEEILERVSKDVLFHRRSKGGITLSGGEPLAQGDFAIRLLKLARSRRMSTAIETSGYVSIDTLLEAGQLVDTIFYDLKHWDDKKHLKYTGKSNSKIISNLHDLAKTIPNEKIKIRIPVIPGYNDTVEDLLKIRSLIPESPEISVELLKYHSAGEKKYTFLGRRYPFKGKKIDEAKMSELKSGFALGK